MSDSLRDQLLGLGFKPNMPQQPEKTEQRYDVGGARAGPKAGRRPQPPSPRKSSRPEVGCGDIGLAKAYAIRAQREKDERIETERLKQEAVRARREAKAKLAALLVGKALNVPEAEIVRHFPYGDKIKRIYVTPEQLRQLNAGELGVVQLNGGYLLVDAATLVEAEALFAPAVALKNPPGTAPEADPVAPSDQAGYADPKYQVPDDLVW